MKKLLSILFVMLLFVSLPSCEKEDDPATNASPTVNETDKTVETKTETAVIDFLLSYKGDPKSSWDQGWSRIPDYVGTYFVVIGLDSAKVIDESIKSDLNDVIARFTLALNIGDHISNQKYVCDYVNSNNYQTSIYRRDYKINVEEGGEVFVKLKTREDVTTHFAKFTIKDGLIDKVTTFNFQPNATTYQGKEFPDRIKIQDVMKGVTSNNNGYEECENVLMFNF